MFWSASSELYEGVAMVICCICQSLHRELSVVWTGFPIFNSARFQLVQARLFSENVVLFLFNNVHIYILEQLIRQIGFLTDQYLSRSYTSSLPQDIAENNLKEFACIPCRRRR